MNSENSNFERAKKNAYFLEFVYKPLSNIATNNEALDFLLKRINGKGYQGHPNVNHNRVSVKKYFCILQNIALKNILKVPPGDDGRIDMHDYSDYQDFVAMVKKNIGQGTINSIKKNIFPDMERYGFIIIEKLKELPYRLVRLSNLGTLFINQGNVDDDASCLKMGKILDEQVRVVHSKLIEKTKYVLDGLSRNKGKLGISFFEFLFFVNIPDGLTKNATDSQQVEKSISLINSYRLLSWKSRLSVAQIMLNNNMDRQKNVEKKYKFDFGNWKNDTQQVLDTFRGLFILNVSPDFDIGYGSSIDKFGRIKMKRSQSIKDQYMKIHSLKEKIKGFEFHHIVPFSMATSEELWNLIENPLNLLYIDAFTHSKFSTSGNSFLFIENGDAKQINLSSLSNETESLLPIVNVHFNFSLFHQYYIHNKKIHYIKQKELF